MGNTLMNLPDSFANQNNNLHVNIYTPLTRKGSHAEDKASHGRK